MKINILRGILILLLLGTFIMIFNFSNEDSEKSGSTSREITKSITKNIDSIQKLNKEEKNKVLDRIESVIRKIAHFTIYMVVGLLSMLLLSTYKIVERNRIIISLAIGIIYSMTDEFHQTFIQGRSGEITDVFLDSQGVLLGILIIMLILKIANKIKEKKGIKA